MTKNQMQIPKMLSQKHHPSPTRFAQIMKVKSAAERVARCQLRKPYPKEYARKRTNFAKIIGLASRMPGFRAKSNIH